ncbi:copper resistance protein CopZ [Bacillus sp. FJAT-27231]|uniref:copper chaperone CopZ n=1 Tax=Bacillus sp. FJAT-27231 TaxID=1679168 RepID=UPI000670A0C1|nr:copper chaperone CopZ [Bacillus sp. FJAT-27231]KMY52533.1 copper resistance protein CopZ [Bacillus sp. FJAT-27231]
MKETLKVQGMSCNHCVNSIEGSVGQLAGISSVNVNLSKGEVTVEFDNQQTTLDKIKETIEDQGYDVV